MLFLINLILTSLEIEHHVPSTFLILSLAHRLDAKQSWAFGICDSAVGFKRFQSQSANLTITIALFLGQVH